MATSASILVTGSRGQLGCDLTAMLSDGYAVSGFDVDTVDITDSAAVAARIERERPDVVIHAAAYTDVDGCEANEETAMSVNSTGTKHVATACREFGARLIYYSTDYVFDGNSAIPYTEEDKPNPQTVYGRSKLAGERAVAATLEDYAILRISWVYGAHGKNFIKTMLGLGDRQLADIAAEKKISPLKVVDDQVGNPTWTRDIVRQTQVVIEQGLIGLFHSTAEGSCSWYQFACDVFSARDMKVQVGPCSSVEYPRPAARPAMSALDNTRLKAVGANVMGDYRESVREFLAGFKG